MKYFIILGLLFGCCGGIKEKFKAGDCIKYNRYGAEIEPEKWEEVYADYKVIEKGKNSYHVSYLQTVTRVDDTKIFCVEDNSMSLNYDALSERYTKVSCPELVEVKDTEKDKIKHLYDSEGCKVTNK